MGQHIDTRSKRSKHDNAERDKFTRRQKTSFKQYLRDLEEELLEAEYEDSEFDDLDDTENQQT